MAPKQLRAIAEESFDVVADYKGSHSGEHGDGIVRSEFHEKMFGARLVGAFEEVKDRFDPTGVLNPGKIVRAPKMDDRELFRFPPGYAYDATQPKFDWSGWPGGMHGAVEMCNNNGACRKLAGGCDVPLLSRNAERTGPDAGACQHAQAGADRAVGAERFGLGRDGRNHEALRRLQGLQARMPDVGRYGQDED